MASKVFRLLTHLIIALLSSYLVFYNSNTPSNRETYTIPKPIELPKLSWSYNSLEPYISGEINKIHHSKHHQTYIDNYNKLLLDLMSAIGNRDFQSIAGINMNLEFNAGGHFNHVLFWQSLSPIREFGGKLPDEQTAFSKQVILQFGSFENLIALTKEKLKSIQGSGWAFIVKKDRKDPLLDVIVTSNQDPVLRPMVPLIAIDAWEHAYYLQYQNVKLDYFNAIWHVINWSQAAKNFDEN